MYILRSTEKSHASFYRRFQNKTLILPHQQRGHVWDESKMEAWWAKIKKGGTLSGCVTSYVLQANAADCNSPNSIWFLNDGAQRVYYTLAHYAQLYPPEEFMKYLENAFIVEQQVIYDDLAEAIDEFINLNAKGTMCTPLELTRSIFVGQLPDFITWEPMFHKLNKGMELVLAKMGCKYENPLNNGRLTTHKRYRDNLALWWRFATHDTTRKHFRVAKAMIDHSQWSKEVELEILMAAFLKSQGYAASMESLDQFLRYIETTSSFYLQIWRELKPKLAAPSNVHFRWWMHAAIYADNIDIPEENMREFTERLISHSGGRTSIFYNKDGEQYNCNTQLSNLTNLTTILKAIGCDVSLFEPKQRRKKRTEPLVPGMVHSHVDSFSAYGENETMPENARENGTRSARSMSSKEKERLKKLNEEVA